MILALCAGFGVGFATAGCLVVLSPRDSTDGGLLKRSGAKLLRDYQTGLEYLCDPRPGYNGVTPRLTRNGKHKKYYPDKEK